jgi:hypothetical protein
MALAQIREGLRYLLDTIDGLRVYAAFPSNLEVPGGGCAAAVNKGPIDYQTTFGRPLQPVTMEVIVVASRGGDDERASVLLDTFVWEQIPTALYSDTTVNGCLFAGGATAAADSVTVVSSDAYAPLVWNGLDLLGCRIDVLVRARRT